MRPARRKHQIAERSASRDEPELMDPGLEDCPNLTRIPLRTQDKCMWGGVGRDGSRVLRAAGRVNYLNTALSPAHSLIMKPGA